MARSVCTAIALLFGTLHSLLASAEGPMSAEQTVAAMKLHEGLAATVFASEPMITNPTNIAVDERGRVWVCDVVNYRDNQGKRPDGDRILILEDEDGDGRADKSTVFYQGHDVDSALGICVLGDNVIVSCSPDVFILTDTDGDDRADEKQILYTKTGNKQHDHSAHAFVFGPDGCLYWNVGNEHDGVFDAQGNVVHDNYGREVRNHGKPFRHGMAFRQNIDGSDFEVLAHNLRNSYELTVDAFGGVWFTDNDDDGNRGTRFCYTLEGGNYGYTEETTGRGWRSPRVGRSPDVPIQHWHQNDPGSIPNVLNNGSGSPSGVEVYEGRLLPDDLYGGIIHCEPGHNVVRVYQPQPEGAGYTAETIELIDGRSDSWFRPVDTATAPDGSVMIADWYDPGVGGHRQADIDRGRIYRVAPTGSSYKVAVPDWTVLSHVSKSLCSGNQAVLYLAWDAIESWAENAESELIALSESRAARERSRAFWILTRFPQSGVDHWKRAAEDADARVRCAAARMTNQVPLAAAAQFLTQLANDPSPQVRREVAIQLRNHHQEDFAPYLWARLAQQHDGEDRWYLEALGLAAEFSWDACLDAWLDRTGVDGWRSPAGRQIVWRSRGAKTLHLLTELLTDESTPVDEVPSLLRALAFNSPQSNVELLLKLATDAQNLPEDRKWLIATEALRHVDWSDSTASSLTGILETLLAEGPRDVRFLELVMRYRQQDFYDELFEVALNSLDDENLSARLVRFLLQQKHLAPFEQQLATYNANRSMLARTIANTGERNGLQLLFPLITDPHVDLETSRELVRALAANKTFASRMLELDEAGELPSDLQSALSFALRAGPWGDLARRHVEVRPELSENASETIPIAELMKVNGRSWRGKEVFTGKANCATCHKIGDEGKEVGPGLSEIGSKLSRTGLYEAVLYPSAAISHNYETYVALTDAGTAIKGVLLSQTDDTVTLKTEKAVVHELQRDELEAFKKQTTSLMPDGLHKLISPQQLADLVAYLQQLKKK